ncbi:hypothetical protein P280DRAFT_72400 [Massarina eburnea CBS 473.64]|uniref:Uncharacterized protein n=1 Tax=Massarina eburnea CBS 473.64 TaxID=1395130 RepID=A0A6A6RTS7_9PLEO|nr:hypothetical protein P280DRAFT_72400 [Massarina eburnea CBS 473.64]
MAQWHIPTAHSHAPPLTTSRAPASTLLTIIFPQLRPQIPHNHNPLDPMKTRTNTLPVRESTNQFTRVVMVHQRAGRSPTTMNSSLIRVFGFGEGEVHMEK